MPRPTTRTTVFQDTIDWLRDHAGLYDMSAALAGA